MGCQGDIIRKKCTILAKFRYAGIINKIEVNDEYDIIWFREEQGGGGWE